MVVTGVPVSSPGKMIGDGMAIVGAAVGVALVRRFHRFDRNVGFLVAVAGFPIPG